MSAPTPLERARDRFLADARQLAPGEEDTHIGALRAAALDVFASQGLPHTKLEEWRYTNVTPLARLEAGLAPAVATPSRERVEPLLLLPDARRAVVVDGRFAPELSNAGDAAQSIAALRRWRPDHLADLGRLPDLKAHPFAALNTALLDDGLALQLRAREGDARPLYLLFISTGGAGATNAAAFAAHPRVLIVAEALSETQVVIDHLSLGEAAGITNAVIETCVGPNAQVDLTLVQREHAGHFHVSGLHVEQRRASRFRARTLCLGGALVRNDLSLLLAEEGAECRLEGLFIGGDSQVLDNHTLVDHAVPHCTSDELYKGLLGGSSRGVFRGRVVVRPHAQQTAATQSNPNLLLGRKAEIDSKPQLEIYADDVKCSHGSTIGQLDADAVFYLQARGIGEDAARELLTRAFAAEILESLPVPGLADALEPLVLDRLRAARQEATP
jgi:Fe-S cluster assembly protein SufD